MRGPTALPWLIASRRSRSTQAMYVPTSRAPVNPASKRGARAFPRDRALLRRRALVVDAEVGRLVAAVRQVRVHVDQARQAGVLPEVDDGQARRCHRTRLHRFDATVADDDGRGAVGRSSDAVDETCRSGPPRTRNRPCRARLTRPQVAPPRRPAVPPRARAPGPSARGRPRACKVHAPRFRDIAVRRKCR